MKTYFLKFLDEDEAIEHLAAYISPEGEWLTASHEHALDVIGAIHKPAGVMLDGEDGTQYPELALVEGFHVNLAIAELPEGLLQFKVEPEQPVRVFA